MIFVMIVMQKLGILLIVNQSAIVIPAKKAITEILFYRISFCESLSLFSKRLAVIKS